MHNNNFYYETTQIQDLEVGDILVTMDSYSKGPALFSLTAVTDLSYVICNLGLGNREQLIAKSKGFDYSFRKLVKIRHIPEGFDLVVSYLSKCIARGWHKKCWNVAKEFNLLWWLDMQDSNLDGFMKEILDKNNITVEDYKNILSCEESEQVKELTVEQKEILDKIRGDVK